ncbi:MAG: OadG family protein [Lachnospiraceae bacterium]|jgi:sodium pump decarboxylase gamma subunit|nr:OadG family protein [Lachnospiraceae bacterium]
MKKKILLMVSVCLMILGLTACGKTDPKSVDYNGYTYDQLKTVTQNTVVTLVNMTDEQREAYETSEDEVTQNIVKRWKDATSGVGSYVGLSDFKITKSGKTLTCEQLIKFEKRDVILTYVYTYYSMEVNDVTVDKVYSLGEKMNKAAMNTLMGMGTVFAVLILISLVISCFRIFPYLEKKKAEENADSKAADSGTPQITDMVQQDDLELVAAISAAIAMATGSSTDDFVVRSIKRRY